MFTKTLFTLSALAGAAVAQFCAEADRFGTFTVSPNPIVLGQPVTINASFVCSANLGYPPVYNDYFLVVPATNNSGFQAPIYFARRDAPASGTDVFNVTFDPNYVGFTTYPDAQYEIQLSTTYTAHSDSEFGQTLATGSVAEPVSVVQASN